MTEKKRGTIQTIWFFLSRYKLYFIFIIFLALIMGLFESLIVAFIYPITQIATNTETGVNTNPIMSLIEPIKDFVPINDDLIAYGLILLTISILLFITKIVYYYLSVKFTARVVKEVKQDVFNKCLNADYQFFVDQRQGEIIYKTSSAPNSISTMINSLTDIFAQLFLSVSVFTMLLTMSWKLVIILIIAGGAYYYVTKYLSTKVSYVAGQKQKESGQRERVILTEYTSGIKQIKVFETFPYWEEMYHKALNTFWFYHRKNYFWTRLPEILLWLFLYSSIGVAIIFIRIQYPGNFKDVIPLIAAFAFGVFLILPKISRFGQYRMKLMNLLPNVEAVKELLKDKNYNKIENGTKEFEGLEKGIEIRNVSFSHKERDILLKNFNLKIEKDSVTALVGASGSGKSTIVNLLLRLYDVEEGGVFIDDVNIKEYDIYSFLKKVGFVSQDTFIYNASVKENISFGTDYSDEDVIRAACLANADDFIRDLPEGYDTVVGDRGLRLSGGEKQRIAIARAMIRQPEILILDEATSSLDNVSENVVQEAIDKVSKSCTTFVIAHRLSTIQNADVINVLDKGKVIEKGSHEVLLSKKGKYSDLYNVQNKNNKNK